MERTSASPDRFLQNPSRYYLAAIGIAIVLAFGGKVAEAAPISPTFDTFGTLSGATFGGTGIPNNAVAITRITSGGYNITLGLTAHGRFFNPPLTNDGAGTFFASPGANFGNPSPPPNPSAILGATWNFAFYVGLAMNSQPARFELLYDFDPGYFTDETDHGRIVGNIPLLPGSVLQDSYNNMFSFLSTPSIGPLFSVFPPSVPFDPNANGSYTFALRAYDTSGNLLGQSAIRVNVGDVVIPEPATVLTFAVGTTVVGLSVRRLRRRVGHPTAVTTD
ncbi:MAG: hypothetical protein NZM31_07905 [Gemmatales bacterium]|nr:hypothetical protein [Gemmatales bacterium]MDW8386917.1 hypothetical protein [Gemmatales bacterium]